MEKVINGELNPALGLIVESWLDLRDTDIEILPDNLHVKGDLFIDECNIKKLPNGLRIDGSLYMRETKITYIPDDLIIRDYIEFGNNKISNYPLVHNCGYYKRTIFLDFNKKEWIRIGSWVGTKQQAFEHITRTYKGASRDLYINQIKECFDMWKEKRLEPFLTFLHELPDIDQCMFREDNLYNITNEWICGSFAGRSFSGQTHKEAVSNLMDYLDEQSNYSTMVGDTIKRSGWPNLEKVGNYLMRVLDE